VGDEVLSLAINLSKGCSGIPIRQKCQLIFEHFILDVERDLSFKEFT
jgi:hypothetical protein